MRIGIDLDNTIVCYDELFVRLARDQELVPASVPAYKQAIRDWLRRQGKEEHWTVLQGMVYGSHMSEATAFPGVEEFLQRCLHVGLDWFIISHRSKVPYAGEPFDLHEAARNWLRSRGILTASTEDRVVLETTVGGKIQRIRDLACDTFVDDLPELLTEPAFPRSVRRILFDPANQNEESNEYERATSWNDVGRLVGV